MMKVAYKLALKVEFLEKKWEHYDQGIWFDKLEIVNRVLVRNVGLKESAN